MQEMSVTGGQYQHHCSCAKATVALQTIGCKLNQAESELLARRLIKAGYRLVPADEHADVFILNTCTVTHIADRKCRQYLRYFHRRNPNSLVVALGCYAERDATGLGCIERVDLVIGNADKDRVVEIIEAQLGASNKSDSGNRNQVQFASLFRTRAMIKIQDGCSHHCSYCIVPYVRGGERSLPAESIIAETKARVGEGCKEIILTGTRIGAYGGSGGLEGLLKRILDETAVARLRLSSLQPRELSPSLIRLWSDNERMCRHLHLALQSGCDSVLRRMNREYSTGEYQAAVNAVRDAMPDMAITTDVMVGFPGEDDGEFEQSSRFCEKVGFAKLHIFAYSPRPGTPASLMADRVPEKVKKDRSQAMLDLGQQSAQRFRRSFFGRTMPVLWEERKGDHLWVGHTGNYLKVVARSDEPLANRLLQTKLGIEYEDALWGDT